jgi:hypothetical protein
MSKGQYGQTTATYHPKPSVLTGVRHSVFGNGATSASIAQSDINARARCVDLNAKPLTSPAG